MPQKNEKLTIWLIQDGEQLPLIEGAKPMRTWRLGEELARRGHEVIWWSSNFHHMLKKKVCDGDLDYKIKENFTIKLLDCGSYKKNLSIARILHHRLFGKKLHKAMRRMPKPDRIVASHPSIESSYEGTKYGKEFDVPVIVDVRDMWPDMFKDYFPKIFSCWIDFIFHFMKKKAEFSFNYSNSLVSMSPNLLEWAKKETFNNNKSCAIFYLGADESQPNPKEKKIKETLDFIKDKILYLYLGVLGSSYDLETIIEVARKRYELGDKKSLFIIAGEGPKKEKLIKLSKGSKNILFLGWLDRKESHYWMKKCDVFLVPNITCAMPNKLFEGLFHGKPVLFTLFGEAKKILESENAGLYYPPKSISKLNKLIDMTLVDDFRTTIGKNAANLYKEKLSSKKIYSDYTNFIEKLNL